MSFKVNVIRLKFMRKIRDHKKKENKYPLRVNNYGINYLKIMTETLEKELLPT